MKRHKSITLIKLILFAILAFVSVAQAQLADDFHIRLHRINDYAPGYIPSWLEAGVPTKFTIQIRSDSDDVPVADEAFQIYSPDGATWEPIVGYWTDDLPWDYHFFGHKWWFYYSVTGEGADTVFFSGWNDAFPQICFPTGAYHNAFEIYTSVDSLQVGNTICLDSTWQVSWGVNILRWIWVTTESRAGQPDWSGPHCFTIVSNCCQGQTGDINGDGNDANILDMNWLVNYLFRLGSLPPCMNEADINGDGSTANILDMNWLVNYLFRGGALPMGCQ